MFRFISFLKLTKKNKLLEEDNRDIMRMVLNKIIKKKKIVKFHLKTKNILNKENVIYADDFVSFFSLFPLFSSSVFIRSVKFGLHKEIISEFTQFFSLNLCVNFTHKLIIHPNK